MCTGIIEFIKWVEEDKMPGLQSIISHFRNEYIKYNNTGARM